MESAGGGERGGVYTHLLAGGEVEHVTPIGKCACWVVYRAPSTHKLARAVGVAERHGGFVGVSGEAEEEDVPVGQGE